MGTKTLILSKKNKTYRAKKNQKFIMKFLTFLPAAIFAAPQPQLGGNMLGAPSAHHCDITDETNLCFTTLSNMVSNFNNQLTLGQPEDACERNWKIVSVGTYSSQIVAGYMHKFTDVVVENESDREECQKIATTGFLDVWIKPDGSVGKVDHDFQVVALE